MPQKLDLQPLDLQPLDLELSSSQPDKLSVPSGTSMLGSLYDNLFNAPDFVTNAAKKAANWITEPELDDWRITSYGKGMLGGMLEGAASQLSPVNIATLGRGKLPQALTKATGLAQILHGGHEVAQGDVMEGIGDMAFGTLGSAMSNGPDVRERLRIGSAKPEPKAKLLMKSDVDPNFNQGLGDPMLAGSVPYPHTSGLPPQEGAVFKLLDAMKSSVPLNKEQQKIYSAERAQKLGKVEDVKTTGQAGFADRLAALGGKHTQIVREPLKLEQPDVDELFDTITSHPKMVGFNQFHAGTGLSKLLEGKVPQRNELEALQQVFGPEVRSLAQIGPDKAGLVSKVVNIPRKLMATLDFSPPFRQGLGVIHKKEWYSSLIPMFKSWADEGYYHDLIKSIEEKPTFKLQQESGLALTDVTSLTNREEDMVATFVDNLPGVARSERAYSAFLNKLRSDVFDSLINDARKAGADVDTDLTLTKELANFVNTATGRGSLGKLEDHAIALNSALFSPRLIASRLTMLNPMYYVNASPQVRKEALKSLFAITAGGTTLGQIARLGGAEVEGDPRSSDFGKIKIGNTRVDPFGGFQQYVTLASRLISNESKSSRTGNTYELGGRPIDSTRLDVTGRFLEAKANPVINFVTGWLRGRDFRGEPFHIPSEVANRVTPMMLADIYELAKEDPKLLPLAIPGMLGMGVQTYK